MGNMAFWKWQPRALGTAWRVEQIDTQENTLVFKLPARCLPPAP